MSLPTDQILISADDHLDIHAMPVDMWSTRLPQQWRERGPRVEETPDGPYWFCDGARISPSGRKEKGYIAAHDHGFRPGQPATRLEDLDRDGVHATVVYGPTCTQLRMSDAALHEQVSMVYNDWAAEFQKFSTRPADPAARPALVRSAGRQEGALALREARPQGRDRLRYGRPRRTDLRGRVGRRSGMRRRRRGCRSTCISRAARTA